MKKPKLVPSTDAMYKADVKSSPSAASTKKSYDPSHHLGDFLHPKKAKGRKK